MITNKLKYEPDQNQIFTDTSNNITTHSSQHLPVKTNVQQQKTNDKNTINQKHKTQKINVKRKSEQQNSKHN